jgi:hypothetical protein
MPVPQAAITLHIDNIQLPGTLAGLDARENVLDEDQRVVGARSAMVLETSWQNGSMKIQLSWCTDDHALAALLAQELRVQRHFSRQWTRLILKRLTRLRRPEVQ